MRLQDYSVMFDSWLINNLKSTRGSSLSKKNRGHGVALHFVQCYLHPLQPQLVLTHGQGNIRGNQPKVLGSPIAMWSA